MGNNNKFYAIVEGEIAPVICTSLGVAAPLVQGYSGCKYKAFKNLRDAKAYLVENGKAYYYFIESPHYPVGDKIPGRNKIHVVAHGREPGFYKNFDEGARDETEAFPNSCHKAVKSIEEGLLFRRDYRTTTAIVNKLRSGEEDPAQALEELISKLRL